MLYGQKVVALSRKASGSLLVSSLSVCATQQDSI